VRQPGIEFQTQNVLDFAHSDPWCGHAGSSKSWKGYPLGLLAMRNTITPLYDTVPVS
jgi:hypothetical protein